MENDLSFFIRHCIFDATLALKDEDFNVRGMTAQALGIIKDPRAVEPLIQGLKDDNSYVRSKAAIALGIIKDPRAVDPLIKALKDNDSTVQNAVEGALEVGWQRDAL